MGFARGSLLSFVGFLLFLSLLIGNIFWTTSLSLEYNQFKSEITPEINSVVIDALPNESMEIMQIYCENESDFNFNLEEFNINLTIPCEVIDSGKEAFAEYGVEVILEEGYYKEYDCSFLDCLTEENSQMIVFSKVAKDFLQSKFLLFLLISLVLIAVTFLLVSSKLNLLPILGAIIIASAFPIKSLNSVVSFFMPAMFEDFAMVFVSRAPFVFSIVLTIGIVLLVLGLILKFLKFDSIKKKFTKKEVEEIVKKEIDNSKKEKK
jgi:hypothetical protein